MTLLQHSVCVTVLDDEDSNNITVGSLVTVLVTLRRQTMGVSTKTNSSNNHLYKVLFTLHYVQVFGLFAQIFIRVFITFIVLWKKRFRLCSFFCKSKASQ